MKTTSLSLFLAALLTAIGLSSCSRPEALAGRPVVYVTTTMIETAVRDVAGDFVEIKSLMPPGSCPGHFDLEPGAVRGMRDCLLFVRHDFQAFLDERLLRSGIDPARIAALNCHGAMTIPTNYVNICRQLVDCLEGKLATHASRLVSRMNEIQARAAAETARALRELETTNGKKVVTAYYQADFCLWAGLEVVGTFTAGEHASALDIAAVTERAKTEHAQALIGNLQSGKRAVSAMAEILRLPTVVLSNFPASGARGAYWELFADNVRALTGLAP